MAAARFSKEEADLLVREVQSHQVRIYGAPGKLPNANDVKTCWERICVDCNVTFSLKFVTVRIWDPSHVPWLGFVCTFCCAFGLVVLWRKFIRSLLV